ncbi:N-acetylmuramoyl-L-alanine amidase [Paenibacillus lemnae]|uniref:N-acetylmuramoyl-L-alanine amidase n=1 Tax=Paenibacillus lemnae TaxID=1330551 RepID=A0A848MBP2_PAELE|nr:N-acetylmuramoyl-L-alanine amidase [Paenibacillus lemnae]NMO98115.1 N-acetylmuramoyl-L-alanine amidase [Paenibacillus lemnae]
MKKVWIDAGHGGKDPGAAGNGLQEKDVVLTLALGIKTKLEAEYQDVQVLLSRSTDVFLELPQRTAAANRAGADILVSVHCNAGGGAGGFESFRFTNPRAESVTLQNHLHTEIMAALRPFGVTDRGQKAANLHMVRESAMPAVLTENLFVDVSSDAVRLKRPEVIAALIQGHAAGIGKHLGLQPKKVDPPAGQPGRDINVVSPWAASAWDEAVANGLFDGSRPGAPLTREEAAIVFNRLRNQMIALMKKQT